jgi:uncharacterized protein YndB with AHSA1/START domain
VKIEVVNHEIVGYIDIAASQERVFESLCHSERWWGSPDMYQVTHGTTDLVLGGEFISEGIMSDGKPFYVKGKIVKLDPPIEFAYTWNASWESNLPETTVTYRLEVIGTGTRVHLTHGSFVNHDEDSASHYLGWTTVLGWLKTYCEN